MTDDKKPDDSENTEPTGSTDAEGLIEAEGPDIETSFSDDDLAFLADPSAAASTDVDPAVEILGDLKRVQAEFANYRKRVERDREATRELNIAEVVKALLPVLDDLALAEAHGDLTDGPMVVIVQKLRAGLDKFGLTSVGAKGDVFDPNLHEALVQLPTPDVTVNTVADVIAPGYKIGERLLRPAKVAVAVPAE
ncbi:nucleotide exchange factor GrpE [Lacisediminihabitans changchengi]|uniref:Protein GrpE n=1 Tax=Lacisediminihabitans changchengi TaxID=2787634 RepID=A0A934SNF0_9MICO|nr:nucleotide exchange factor GrpE [Lacisediminihabitans changchengi]MBK4348626.1 nucleotide exchange factor GrpE [Lacisediminihabitans changchengi]